MITFTANSRQAKIRSDDLVTSHSIGIPVVFDLSEDFDDLQNVAVFKGSGHSVDVIFVHNTCVVPPECLTEDGGFLSIGVYGRNADGTIAIPTIWAEAQRILKGTLPSGIDPSQPVPDWTAQVQAIAEDALANSETAISTANDAKTAAITAQDSAQASASAAHQSELNAATSAGNAYASEVYAATSAGNASASALQSAQSAQNSSYSATNAHNSEVNAADSAAAAHSSEQNAENARRQAAQSAQAAGNSAHYASASETNAGNSATNAHNSEVTAKGYSDDAWQYASNALGSANDAHTSEVNAAASAASAAASVAEIQGISATASTLPEGSSATASYSNGVLSFGIPKGDKGDASTITVGTTTTLAAGSSATVTNSGTSSAAVLNFGIPQGEKGDTGDSGVYIGTSTPTDPDVNVWIDTSGTSSVSADDIAYNDAATYQDGTVGKELQDLAAEIAGLSGISTPIKQALLQLASKVAYIDEDGQDYYQDLYDALYPLTSITAVYTQSGTVYTTDSLDSLKTDLVVTAVYDGGSPETVPSTDYTLSGSLTEGTSVITVSYGGKTTTFNVTVTAVPDVYTIVNTLTGCTNSNSSATITEGTSYSGEITASTGYTLTGATVSITMGGTDITASAYNNGTISIASVTGNIVITVAAVAVTLASISAVFTQGQTVVYDTDSLDSLKSMLVVTATYSDTSTQTVPSADYTLSGTLTVGTSTITVSYGGKTDTFTVTVTSGSQTITISWSGTGTDNSCSAIDARNADVYWELPYIAGSSDYASDATSESDFVRLFAILYSDAELTNIVGYWFIDTQTIEASARTTLNRPSMPVDTLIKVAPAGYYVKLGAAKRAGFSSNASCRNFLNANATDVKLVAVGGA